MESTLQMRFKSQATLCPERRDVRELVLFGQFYMLDEMAAKALQGQFAQFVLETLGDQSIQTWEMYSGKTKKMTTIGTAAQDKILHESYAATYGYSLRGYFLGEAIHDRKSMKEYERRLLYPANGTNQFERIPKDFQNSFLQLIARSERERSTIVESLLALFSEEGRIPMMRLSGTDFQGLFCVTPYRNRVGKFHGTFELEIPVSCFQGQSDLLAQKMRCFLLDVNRNCANLNAGVTTGAIPQLYEAHMEYFSCQSIAEQDKSYEAADCIPAEWYPTYFLNGVHWFNLISPLVVTSHLRNITPGEYGGIGVRPLANGAWTAALNTDILAADVSNLAPLKRLLYAALYPGQRKIPLNKLLSPSEWSPGVKPRMYWERIPIFPEELTVTDTDIVFSHRRNGE